MRIPLVLSIACQSPDDGRRAPRDSAPHDVTAQGDDTARHDDTGTSDDSGGDDSGGDDTAGGGGDAIPEGAFILDHARVLDAVTLRADAAVVVVADVIWDVRDAGGPWPDDATVWDATGLTVLPGLIDAHVHLFHSGATTWLGSTLADNLRAQLAWGVTTVADLGSPATIVAVRDRIARGELVGPTIWSTGPFLTAEGSHPCETFPDHELCLFVAETGAEAAVASLGATDGLKVALADADFTPWPTPRLDLSDLADVVDAAGDRPVVVHIDEPDDAADAAVAGARWLAHPVFSESAAMPLPFTSTLGAFSGPGDLVGGDLLSDDLSTVPAPVRESWEWLADHPEAFLEGWLASAAAWSEGARGTVAAALAADGVVIPGSDAGYSFVPHGLGLHRELAALVDLGMSPRDALAAATLHAAQLLDFDDRGLVAPGMRADLVVVGGAPEIAIADARDVRLVILGGQVVDLAAPLRRGLGDPACLDDADCATDERCDLVHHRCGAACAAWSVDNACGSGWCRPVEGWDEVGKGVCVDEPACALLAQDCSDAYALACVPADRDTTRCIPAGPRVAGEACVAGDPELGCTAGHLCSPLDGTCYAFCSPDADDSCATCTPQWWAGSPLGYALCL